jgi:hypothetical protein
MALTAKNILDRASMIIQDLTNVRWPETEILNWLNDARRELAVVRPDIYSDMATKALTTGAKQSLPADGLRLMDIPRNTSGAAITVTQRGFLDQQNPGWHQMTGSATIKHFMVDERNPSTFWVYPPATSAASVELIYQKAPTDYTTSSTLTAYEELYGGAMVDYVCYRAFSKDSEYAGNANRALAHYTQFANALGIGRQQDIANSANANNIGGAANNPRGGGIGGVPTRAQG